MTHEPVEVERLLALLWAAADSVLELSDEDVRAELAELGERSGPSVGEIIAAQLKKTQPATPIDSGSDAEPPTAPVRAAAPASERGTAKSPTVSREAAVSVTEGELRALLEKGMSLSHAQQRLLFTDPPTRERFLALRHQHAAYVQTPAGPAIAEMRTRIAAAGPLDDKFERPLAGGTLRINPVGIGKQVYVVFSFDDPAVATRVLILDRARDERIERVDLPLPDAGEIVLIKDLAVPAEAALVDMLRDPSTSGVFLR